MLLLLFVLLHLLLLILVQLLLLLLHRVVPLGRGPLVPAGCRVIRQDCKVKNTYLIDERTVCLLLGSTNSLTFGHYFLVSQSLSLSHGKCMQSLTAAAPAPVGCFEVFSPLKNPLSMIYSLDDHPICIFWDKCPLFVKFSGV